MHSRKKKAQRPNREFTFKEEEQEYAQVEEMLGDSRIRTRGSDGVVRDCTIRGSMKKRVWIAKGDWVLIAMREFSTSSSRADVILKYSADEVKHLYQCGELRYDEQDTEGVVFADQDPVIDDI